MIFCKEIYILGKNYILNPLINSEIKYSNPYNFVNSFKGIHPSFKEGQQDVMEFMRFLFEDLSKENNLIKIIPPHILIDNCFKDKSYVYNEYRKNLKTKENSFISNKFYILVINTFICSCGYESYNVDTLLDIPLTLPIKEKAIDLTTLIKVNFEITYISWKGNCIKCKKKNKNHYKQISFGNICDYLFISIQRNTKNLTDLNKTKVSFENILDLKDVIDSEIFTGTTQFELIVIVDHLGNIDYGHYYSYIKLDNNWVKFDDIIIEIEEELDMKSSKVCALLYKKNYKVYKLIKYIFFIYY